MLLTDEKINELKSLISSFDLKEVKQWRTFKVVASTEDSDRSWEIIKASGWDYTNFMKNPVIIANHVYKIENIVGKATSIYVKDNQLIIEWVFSESNPLWKLLADLYEEWMVKTVSVWFIPKSRDESNKRIITSAELLELSFVAVPCNPNALSLDQKQLLQSFWLIKKDTSNQQIPPVTDSSETVSMKCPKDSINNNSSIFNNKNEEVWSSSSLENCCDGGVNDSTDNSSIEENSQNSTKEILSTLNDIKALLETLVDGNTKKLSEANLVAKETLQNVARTVNQGLASFKKSL